MEFNKNQSNKQITQGNLKDPKEFNRILMQYGGVFKNNIRQYAETVIKRQSAKKNYSR